MRGVPGHRVSESTVGSARGPDPQEVSTSVVLTKFDPWEEQGSIERDVERLERRAPWSSSYDGLPPTRERREDFQKDTKTRILNPIGE